MKNLLLICVVVFTSMTAFSQNVTLVIEGFDNTPSTTFVLNSANFKAAPVYSASGQVTYKRVYVIDRNQDAMTVKIMDAITRGRQYKKARLVVSTGHSGTIEHDITNVIFIEYASTNVSGQKPTEQFYLQFQTDEIIEKK